MSLVSLTTSVTLSFIALSKESRFATSAVFVAFTLVSPMVKTATNVNNIVVNFLTTFFDFIIKSSSFLYNDTIFSLSLIDEKSHIILAKNMTFDTF